MRNTRFTRQKSKCAFQRARRLLFYPEPYEALTRQELLPRPLSGSE